MNIFGGKITTYRRLAESMLQKIEARLGAKGPAWTQNATLPGGDFPAQGAPALAESIQSAYPTLPIGLIQRLIRHYGTQTNDILGNAKSLDDLGRCFGADLYEAELRHLMTREWAYCADDVLWRRTKLGLHFTPDQIQALDAWMKENR